MTSFQLTGNAKLFVIMVAGRLPIIAKCRSAFEDEWSKAAATQAEPVHYPLAVRCYAYDTRRMLD
jgi:hypothetical protein